MSAPFFPPVDTRRHRVLSGHSRVRVLEVLRAQARPRTVDDLAARVGLHPNTVRLHLDQLVDAGLVTRARDGGGRPGRPPLVYAAVLLADAAPAREEDGGSRYRLLADVLVDHLEATAPDPAAEAAAAGRAWARTLVQPDLPPPATAEQATAELSDMLDGLGFAPCGSDGPDALALRRCPFGQVPESRSPVVCGIHLGLMQGTLSGRQAPLRVTALEPFVAPGVCVARLAPGPAAGEDD